MDCFNLEESFGIRPLDTVIQFIFSWLSVSTLEVPKVKSRQIDPKFLELIYLPEGDF